MYCNLYLVTGLCVSSISFLLMFSIPSRRSWRCWQAFASVATRFGSVPVARFRPCWLCCPLDAHTTPHSSERTVGSKLEVLLGHLRLAARRPIFFIYGQSRPNFFFMDRADRLVPYFHFEETDRKGITGQRTKGVHFVWTKALFDTGYGAFFYLCYNKNTVRAHISPNELVFGGFSRLMPRSYSKHNV